MILYLYTLYLVSRYRMYFIFYIICIYLFRLGNCFIIFEKIFELFNFVDLIMLRAYILYACSVPDYVHFFYSKLPFTIIMSNLFQHPGIFGTGAQHIGQMPMHNLAAQNHNPPQRMYGNDITTTMY